MNDRQDLYFNLYFGWEVCESLLNYLSDNLDRFSESERKRIEVAYNQLCRCNLAIFSVAYNGVSVENLKILKSKYNLLYLKKFNKNLKKYLTLL